MHLAITSGSDLFMQNKSCLCEVCFLILSGHATDLIFIHLHQYNGYFPLTLVQLHSHTANNSMFCVCVWIKLSANTHPCRVFDFISVCLTCYNYHGQNNAPLWKVYRKFCSVSGKLKSKYNERLKRTRQNSDLHTVSFENWGNLTAFDHEKILHLTNSKGFIRSHRREQEPADCRWREIILNI